MYLCCSAGLSWSSWSSCEPTCGDDRKRTRTRSCQNPGQCIGEATQTQACQSVDCWSPWSSWSQCSVTCGTGHQTRTRVCSRGNNTPSCRIGSTGIGSRDIRTCIADSPSCPGLWSSWSQWSTCAPTCGSGRERTRSRSCSIQGACSGAATDTETCISITCPGPGVETDAGMTQWSPWGKCTRTCGGSRLRVRTCLDHERGCVRPYIEVQTCSESSCVSPSMDNPNQQLQQSK